MPVKDIIPLIASIDIGTTSSRVIFFNKLSQEIAKYQIEYSTTASSSQRAKSAESSKTIIKNATDMNEKVNAIEEQIFSQEGISIKPNAHLCIEKGDCVPTLTFPHQGWCECNPINILNHIVKCFIECSKSLDLINKSRLAKNLKAYEVSSIGIANMRETTIVWSKKTGFPVYKHGIVWNDTRNLNLINGLKKMVSPEFQKTYTEKTGLPLFSTYFSCSKLRWLLNNDTNTLDCYNAKDLMFGTVDSWIIYNFTKQKNHITDVTNASRTGFMNLQTFQYDPDLLNFWGIDKDKLILPQIKSSSEYYGDFHIHNSKEISAHDLKILKKYILGKPIQGCLGDQSASLCGNLCFKPGAAKCTYGTGSFLLFNTGVKKLNSQHGLLSTVGYWFPNLKENKEHAEPHFALEGSIAVAGSCVQWLRDNLRLIPKSEDIGPLASQVSNSGGVVFIPAFSGLFAPIWDSDSRGTIFGLTQYTKAAHIARAALEGICYQVRAILKAMTKDAKLEAQKNPEFNKDIRQMSYESAKFSSLTVDGGMSKSDEFLQIQADILGPCTKVKRSTTSECTAFGAAIAANFACENKEERVLWQDLRDVKKWVVNHGEVHITTEDYYMDDDLDDPFVKVENEQSAIFKSKTSTDERRSGWKRWESAISKSTGWLSDSRYQVDAEGNEIHDDTYEDDL
ncbi:hypothetical protein ACO0QE_003158 [Hanseniaspora vineae]